MKISRIKLANILGHQALEITPGKVNIAKGKNGAGKTSILTAIHAALRGGSAAEATLLRNGEAKGEIVLVLDDGTEITKTVTDEGSKTKITGQSKPASFLDEIRDVVSVNPVQFLMADDKTRVRLLLETLNLQFTSEEVSATGAAPPVPGNLNLEQLDALRKNIYDDRTGVNGQVKKAKSTVEQLLRSLPEVPAEVSAEALAELQTKRDGMQARRTQYFAEIERERQEKIAAVHAECDAKKTELQAKFEATYNPLSVQVTAMQIALQNSAAREQQVSIIKANDSEADALQEVADGLTATLTAIDQLKERKMDNLPIPNLLIKDGKIYVDGVAWEHVNGARKMAFILSVARLRAGALSVVCVDGLECLDDTTFAYFEQAAAAYPELQFFCTRVGTGELTISTN
jgi:energy-coupling factor transporter ATP-binding protein EcfA2